ncbi:hypothetical protein BN11_650015 [Nostocoides australiense Ben110]|uniref:Uncharacterized protein n=1 Tax=Nostocoides australiense Ben110 TaxID=1193182 RepID=W6K1J5_9MICO|nr:hypothetical protein BN11_650015 [Tetrasphaera australiensis Ben110]
MRLALDTEGSDPGSLQEVAPKPSTAHTATALPSLPIVIPRSLREVDATRRRPRDETARTGQPGCAAR